MMENNIENTKADYRKLVNDMGKKEFTLEKMKEYGFWPKNLPTPYERQENETKEEYQKKQELLKDYQKIVDKIAKTYDEKDEINIKLRELKNTYDETWDYEKIRLDVAQKIMKDSIERRAERKRQREIEREQKSEAWNKKKKEEILFIGKGYSAALKEKDLDENRLLSKELPIIKTDKELAEFLGIEYKTLRFLTYHRDVVVNDHYHRFEVSKRRGGFRKIAAPKTTLKKAQKKILEEILEKFEVSEHAHGFIKERSVVSGATPHVRHTELLINMDLENFFPTITFERVRGLFKSFGYSGYISSLFAMICTYCERTEVEVKGEIRAVKTTDRILPQGSPASPMITNIICLKLDKRLSGLADKHGFVYTRYADDMSFSLREDSENNCEEGKFCGLVSKIVSEEGFNINRAKTKFLRRNNRQCITGVVINNEEIGVTRKWIRRFRAAIYNAKRAKLEGNLQEEVVNEISGMAAWVKSVNEKRYRDIINEAMEVIKN